MYGSCEVDEECRSESACGEYKCREISYVNALAHWAKVELLKEKVKERVNAQHGAKLDKVADLISEIIAEKSKNVKDLNKKDQELKTAFEELKFSSN
ncbi:hypothetical protein HYT84_02845 [Candidatus Micrarchaeota archaeon]|nr:hypothetical protein [Candidatus Micrarchaeota archaeon]